MKARTEQTKKAGPERAEARSRAQRDATQGDAAHDCPREQMIAEAAYYRAEQRGFAPGNEMSDWLLAEADVERALGKLH